MLCSLVLAALLLASSCWCVADADGEARAFGRLALVADELGEAAVAAGVRSRLARRLESWLTGRNSDPLLHEQSWGGLVARNGLANSGADFGNGWYNDHHFHYGYLIFAAAAVGRGNASWLHAWRGAVLHLVRDIANPTSKERLRLCCGTCNASLVTCHAQPFHL